MSSEGNRAIDITVEERLVLLDCSFYIVCFLRYLFCKLFPNIRRIQYLGRALPRNEGDKGARRSIPGETEKKRGWVGKDPRLTPTHAALDTVPLQRCGEKMAGGVEGGREEEKERGFSCFL